MTQSLLIRTGLEEQGGKIKECLIISNLAPNMFFEQLKKLSYEFHGDFAIKEGRVYKNIGEGEYKLINELVNRGEDDDTARRTS